MGSFLSSLAAFVVLGCGAPSSVPKVFGVPEEQSPTDSKRVLVVINEASRDSLAIGSYYAQKRKIPHENVLLLSTVATDNIPMAEFERGMKAEIRRAIQKNKFAIDFVVLTKGLPIRINDNGGYSTDAFIAAMDLPIKPIDKPEEAQLRQSANPYFNKAEPFSSRKFGFYLVTRLDGYDVAHVKKLVDNSLAAKPEKGPFFLDAAGNRKDASYGQMQKTLFMAQEGLTKRGFEAKIDSSDDFVLPEGPVAGYASWGSNDAKFSEATYRQIRFKPGALAETFVSTSGRTFTRTTGGQSLIADLIESGVTGVKGYVSEPYTFALARPEILFDRYTSGYNLAESFYMASLVLKWKDVVIGDPLCSPYSKK